MGRKCAIVAISDLKKRKQHYDNSKYTNGINLISKDDPTKLHWIKGYGNFFQGSSISKS
jgi:hypothetical protein